jgi:hypothetical protein
MGVVLVLALACLTLAASASAKPGHHHKCKRNQATVKVRGKKRCKPINSVFPKPRAGDERIAAWQTALAPASGLRDRRGRKLLSLKRGHGNAGRRIYAAFAATMPEAFARLDALGETPRLLRGQAMVSAAKCGSAGSPTTFSFSDTVNGVRVDASLVNSGSSKSLVFSAKSGDLFIRTSLDRDTCSPLNIPDCPTAAGSLDTKGAWVSRLQVKILYFEDADLVSQLILNETRTTRTRGQTAADAKLDHLDIDDALAVSIFSTHEGTEGGSRENVELKRRVRVNMRSQPESYTAGNSASETVSGRSPNLAAWDDTGFGTLVSGLIGAYRSVETGDGFADKPGKCAELKFSPASDTLKLKKGQSGKVKVRVESNGTADNPRATAAKSLIDLTSRANANITPSSGKGDVVPFDYKVNKAGRGIKVSAGFRATSTAGLAKPVTWTQPTSNDVVQTITGTFSGSLTLLVYGPQVHQANFTWTGDVSYKRDDPEETGAAGSYTLESGKVNLTVSGTTALGCTISGSKQITLGPAYGSATVTGDGPYRYSFQVSSHDSTGHDTGVVVVTLSSCTNFPELNGTTMNDLFLDFALDTGFGANASTSADGVQYDGSYSVLGGASWTWSLHRETETT